MARSDYIVGIYEKYPEEILKPRMKIEGNVIACFLKDMLRLDEVKLEAKDFFTKDGYFLFSMLKDLRRKGFYTIDEVTVVSNCNEQVIARINEMGGYQQIQNMIDICSDNNYDTYLDLLYRENVICKMWDDNIDVLGEIEIKKKKVSMLKFFRKLSADDLLDWWEARTSSYSDGYSSSVVEEEEIDFDDEFINKCEQAEEAGVPFDVGCVNIEGYDVKTYRMLSNQSLGLLEKTLSFIGGYSSIGKSSFSIGLIMSLIHRGRKVILISNEETVYKYKIRFLTWIIYNHNKYYKLTKAKLQSGNITDEDKRQIKIDQKYWSEHIKGNLKVVFINTADMGTVKKKIREAALKFGYDAFYYDTFKIQESDFAGQRQDLSLVRDSRELDRIAKKYNMIGLASIQLAEHSKGTLWVSAAQLSNAKQIKEILENLWLFRNIYPQELDPKDKHYCRPFRRIKDDNGVWITEEVELDPNKIYRICFSEKVRSGKNSSDTGTATIFEYLGDYSTFKEVCLCKPSHGRIE